MEARFRAVSQNIPSKVDLLLVGDSLFQLWPEEQLQRTFEGISVKNFGIGSATFQNLSWALANSGISETRPRNVAILIGTNNVAMGEPFMPDCSISEGTSIILEQIRQLWPDTHLIFIPILPRGVGYTFREPARQASADTALNVLANDASSVILNLADAINCGVEHKPSWLDLEFSDLQYGRCANYAPDNVHLSALGYAVLGAALRSVIIP